MSARYVLLKCQFAFSFSFLHVAVGSSLQAESAGSFFLSVTFAAKLA